jgi:hypothetical protein
MTTSRMEETKLRHKLKMIIAQSEVADVKAHNSSTVEEHMFHYPKVQGLILPLPLALGEKKGNIKMLQI